MKISCYNGHFLRSVTPIGSKEDIWFIHGFGESSLCFKEMLQGPLGKCFNLYAPDLPGFGVSPPVTLPVTVEKISNQLQQLIQKVSRRRPVTLIGHSLGALFSLKVASAMREQVKLFVNIDGCLTSDIASQIHSQVKNISIAQDYLNQYRDNVYLKSKKNLVIQRYLSSLHFCDSQTFYSISCDVVKIASDNLFEDEFLELSCSKKFFSQKDTSKRSLDFLTRHSIPIIYFKDAGHWIMIEEQEKCFSTIYQLIKEV